MADRKALQADHDLGPQRSLARFRMQRDLEVCKLVDTTTCIGCKACEVACVEWNDMPFTPTTFDNTYQTMPETRWNFWNLIKFNEHQNPDGTIQWLMRKDQCMHCADPGCLHACPADGAIVKYANGIVDFNQENCIGCEFCVSGCPFQYSALQSRMTKRVYKCTLCSDRVGEGLEPACIKACPTGCLKFGSKDDMKFIAEERAKQLRDNFGWQNAGVYDPAIRRRNACDLCAARRHRSRTLRRPAQQSADSVELHGVEVAVQARARNLRARSVFSACSLHYVTPARACRNRNRRERMAPMVNV